MHRANCGLLATKQSDNEVQNICRSVHDGRSTIDCTVTPIYRVSNYCLSLYFNIAGLQQSLVKRFGVLEFFVSKRVGTLYIGDSQAVCSTQQLYIGYCMWYRLTDYICAFMCVVALETGGVLGLPKMLIDPRRPEVMSPEARFSDHWLTYNLLALTYYNNISVTLNSDLHLSLSDFPDCRKARAFIWLEIDFLLFLNGTKTAGCTFTGVTAILCSVLYGDGLA